MLRDLYGLWFRTGWRSNEIVALRFDWLLPERQAIELRRGRSPRRGGLEASPKTGERVVICDDDPEIWSILERRKRESLQTGKRDFVFTDSRGRPLSQEWLAKRVWNPTITAIGLSPRGQYNIRDTFITLALSAGEDPGWVAEVCGTSEQMIFDHYRSWMPKLRRGHGRQLIGRLAPGPKSRPKVCPKARPKRSKHR
jgi:integrase